MPFHSPLIKEHCQKQNLEERYVMLFCKWLPQGFPIIAEHCEQDFVPILSISVDLFFSQSLLFVATSQEVVVTAFIERKDA